MKTNVRAYSKPVRCASKLVVSAGLSVLLFGGSAGLNCDANSAATIRQTATEPIGNGIKSFVDEQIDDSNLETIVNGVIDGAIAAVKAAGRGSN